MRDALQYIKNKKADSSCESLEALLKNTDNLYLTDFSVLDYYELENNIKDIAYKLHNNEDAFYLEDITIHVSPDIKRKIQDIEDNWIPIIMVKNKSLQTTNFAFNPESSEIQSIDFLTNSKFSISDNLLFL